MVLNALRHHRGRHASDVDSGDSRLRRAQRLAASQRSAHDRPRDVVDDVSACSTPCGITEVGTRARPRSSVGASGCSTPCGITEVGTRRGCDGRRPSVQCSTPCGITEVGTRRDRGAEVSSDDSAQRLAASQRSARRHRVDRNVDLPRCSTPCGITEVGTIAHRGRRMPSCRLCSTPCGITEVGTRRSPTAPIDGSACAQRLAASQRSAHDRLRPWPIRGLSAQRLAASQRSAPRPRLDLHGAASSAQRLAASQRSARRSCGTRSARRLRVLNALRHHRGRHAGQRSVLRTGQSSAQRLAASQRSAPVRLRPMPSRWYRCSTPCGITEVGTRRVDAALPAWSVLNALRHHRGRHTLASRRSIGLAACSTPCGITEVGTRSRRRWPLGARGAQRLAASQRSALPAPNAFHSTRLRRGFSRAPS